MVYVTGLLVLLIFISIALPFAALFGFFDERKDGLSQFRSGRLAIATVVMCLWPLGLAIIVFAKFYHDTSHGPETVEAAVTKNRIANNHRQDNFRVMFPQILPADKQACYAAAISNYVEDQWRGAYHDTTCSMGAGMCSDSEQSFFDKDQSLEKSRHNLIMDTHATADVFKSIWPTAAAIYATIRSFHGILDPSTVGQPNIGTDQKAYDVFHKYITDCATLKPLGWAIYDTPLITSPEKICFGDCK
jgi:hypothetical protein